MTKMVTIVGLDVGSSKINAVAGRISDSMPMEIIAHVSSPSRGIQRGTFIELNEATGIISATLAKLKEKSKCKLENIYVNISGQTIMAERSKGMIPISMRGREITRSDVDRCIQVASTIHLPFDRDIIHRIVHSFSVDDQPSVKNPVGLYASRLACEMYVITANINHVQNIHKSVYNSGYDVKETVFTGLSDGFAMLEQKEREEGAIIVNIGATLTEISTYFSGVLRDLDVVLLGLEDFKGDIKSSETLSDILYRIEKKREELLKIGGKPESITISGGITFTDGIIEFMEQRLGLAVSVGVVREIKGRLSSLDSMRFATAIGLVKYGEEKYITKIADHKDVFKTISSKLVDIFNNYF